MITVTNDFITEEEEKEILSHIRVTRLVKNTGDRNNIIRYGSRLPYDGPIKSATLPEWIIPFIDRIMNEKLLEITPNHMTINEYKPTQSIGWHIDSKTSGEVITILSLMSSATMGLKMGKEENTYHIPQRSLTQMSGKERWDYKHRIYPVKSLRFSLVFRCGQKTIK